MTEFLRDISATDASHAIRCAELEALTSHEITIGGRSKQTPIEQASAIDPDEWEAAVANSYRIANSEDRRWIRTHEADNMRAIKRTVGIGQAAVPAHAQVLTTGVV